MSKVICLAVSIFNTWLTIPTVFRWCTGSNYFIRWPRCHGCYRAANSLDCTSVLYPEWAQVSLTADWISVISTCVSSIILLFILVCECWAHITSHPESSRGGWKHVTMVTFASNCLLKKIYEAKLNLFIVTSLLLHLYTCSVSHKEECKLHFIAGRMHFVLFAVFCYYCCCCLSWGILMLVQCSTFGYCNISLEIVFISHTIGFIHILF